MDNMKMNILNKIRKEKWTAGVYHDPLGAKILTISTAHDGKVDVMFSAGGRMWRYTFDESIIFSDDETRD